MPCFSQLSTHTLPWHVTFGCPLACCRCAGSRPAADVLAPGLEARFPTDPLQYVHGLQGWTLYLRQLRALFVKRALSARRDKWSVLLQLVIPILIVLVAIWTGKVSRLATDDPALAINR